MLHQGFISYNVNDQANLFYLGKTAFDFMEFISWSERNSELMDYIACAPLPKINKEDPHRGVETSNIPW